MRLFLLSGAQAHDAAVMAWLDADEPMRLLARPWFEQMRALGPDVGALMHDGCPTACVEGAAFGYVAAYRAHAAVGFFQGAALPDPAGLLEGAGLAMRHVKLRFGRSIDEVALAALVAAAYHDIHTRLATARTG